MGRGRGKGKKLTAVASHDDLATGGEEAPPVYKRRGRPPQKVLKVDVDQDIVEKIEEVEADNATSTNKEKNVPALGSEYGKKRKTHLQAKDNPESVKEESGVGTRLSMDNVKPDGFRQIGSRRKSIPRRAAEAGVYC